MTALRTRLVLGITALSVAGAAMAPAPLASGVGAAGVPLDVTAADATSAAVEVTARDAYSFVFDPDVQLPRATAAIAADRARATASPADPGDQVDALPGTGIPLAEGMVVGGIQGGAGQAPEPLRTVLRTGASGVQTAFTTLAPVTAQAGVPVEHVAVDYPDPMHPGPSTGTYGADPQVADPTGLLAVDGALGHVTAGPGSALADAGGGAAVTAAALGLHLGRLSAHAETHATPSGVLATAWSEIDDLDVQGSALALPATLAPGLASTTVLHADALRTDLWARRDPGATARAGAAVSASGVTVLGHAARIDSTGVHVDGVTADLTPVVTALDALFDQAAALNRLVPPGGPTGSDPVVPLGHLAGPLSATASLHGGDQATGMAAGLTLTLQATVLVPASTAVPPTGPPQLTPTPVTLQVVLASARVRAYGRTLGTEAAPPVTLPAAAAPVVAAAAVPAPAAAPAVTDAAAPTPAAPAPATAATAAPPGRTVVARLADRLPAGLTLVVGALAEACLLGALCVARRRVRPRSQVARDPAELL